MYVLEYCSVVTASCWLVRETPSLSSHSEVTQNPPYPQDLIEVNPDPVASKQRPHGNFIHMATLSHISLPEHSRSNNSVSLRNHARATTQV